MASEIHDLVTSYVSAVGEHRLEALPAMLALAITGALAFSRMQVQTRARRMLAAALLIGIAADGWIRNLPLPQLPEVWIPDCSRLPMH